MKICCDRCEKPIKQNCLGEFLDCKTITEHGFFRDNKIHLCSNCYNDFQKFLNNSCIDELLKGEEG